MDKIYINVEKKTRMISLTKTKIGNDLENLQQELVFKFTDEFVNGSARLEYKIDSDRYHIPMTKDGESYIVPIKNIITKEGKIEMQLVITQVAQDEEIPVFKSNVFYMYCDRSINAQEEPMDDYEYWLDVIEEKLAEVDEALDELDNVDIDASKSGNKTSSDLGLQPAGDYITNTYYATTSRAGIVKVSNGMGTTMTGDMISGVPRDYTSYTSDSANLIVAKGTLENVITGKGLIDDTYHDSTKQNIIDNTLTTTNKTIPTAINEVNSIAKGANQAVGYNNYSAMITAINAMDDEEYNIGQNVYIVTINVPDLWVSNIESTSSTYTYVDDATVINDLETNGYVQVGYYKLSMLETQKVDLTNYVTNTDYATPTTGGVIKLNQTYATQISAAGIMRSVTKTYTVYKTSVDDMFISKGTLENVFNGKGLLPIVTLTQAEYDALATKDPDTYYYIEES